MIKLLIFYFYDCKFTHNGKVVFARKRQAFALKRQNALKDLGISTKNATNVI